MYIPPHSNLYFTEVSRKLYYLLRFPEIYAQHYNQIHDCIYFEIKGGYRRGLGHTFRARKKKNGL